MTEDTKRPTSSWTFETLEQYFSGKVCALERRMQEQDNRNLERFAAKEAVAQATNAASQRAIDKVELTASEFRKAIGDQAMMLLPRTEYSIQHSALAVQLDLAIKQFGDQINNIAGRLTALETMLATRKEGLSMTGAVVLGGFAALSSVVSVITLLVHITKSG